MERWREERSWRLGALAALLAVVALLTVAGLKASIRARARERAAAHGFELVVREVSLGWFSVTLRGLDVARTSRVVRAHVPEVHVELGASLRPRVIAVTRARIDVAGTPADVWAEVEAIRPQARGGAAARPESQLRWRVSELEAHWVSPDGSAMDLAGIDVTRDGAETVIRVASVSARRAAIELHGGDAEITLGAGATVRSARLGTLALDLAADRASAPPVARPAGPSQDVEPAPPAPGAIAGGSAAPILKALRLPDLGPLEAARRAAVRTLSEHLPDGASYAVDAFTVAAQLGGKPLTVGPGTIVASRHGDRLEIAFASARGAGKAPLALTVDAALDAGPSTLTLSGGAVSLATLGVREQMGGFLDVERGRIGGRGAVTLEEGARRVAFDVDLSLESVTIDQPKIASEPVRDLSFSVRAAGNVSREGAVELSRASFDMGQIHVEGKASLTPRAEGASVRAELSLARATCAGLLASFPSGLVPSASQLTMTGTLGAVASLEMDTSDVDAMQVRYQIDERCRVSETAAELAKAHFEGPFVHRAHHPDGEPYELSTGRGSAEWVDLVDISPYVVVAVLTTEDGAFYKHHGFNHAAIRDSIRANVKAGRFVRGASTISMQLAKNLFLRREKTLARKLEEVVLTSYLEQEWEKDELMELYLNVVELGPDLYGVRAAAEHYFARTPAELNVAESLFLASLLPAPVRMHKLSEKERLSERWLAHLRSLMRIAHRRGTLSSQELEAGLAQEVEFHRDGEPRPPPRTPLRGRRARGAWNDDDPTDPGTE